MKKRQKKRIQIEETVKYLGDFYGPLEHIISDLQSRLDEGWEGMTVEYERDYSWGECDDHKVYYLYRHRPETDKEYEKRIYINHLKELEKKKAEERKAKELRRKEYEKLKKEFGDT